MSNKSTNALLEQLGDITLRELVNALVIEPPLPTVQKVEQEAPPTPFRLLYDFHDLREAGLSDHEAKRALRTHGNGKARNRRIT